jgi:hypothetical protein
MDNLFIAGTKTTPTVNFDFNNGILLISGESYPENSAAFYNPVFEWLNKYIACNKQIYFNFKLVYFNTSSSKAVMDIIDLLENYHNSGGKVELSWHYEENDEDIMDSGTEFTENLKMSCKLVEYKDMD